ncbi:hypothetical protein Afil01_46540 [Actinorhabdospora filicis]|uniref:Knr4/Smi1-like domain-containing protein n=1 Tax=Actinorhabdospora filicis TaxID=1785913 RepID=A0A9W6SQ64_9ACTN|nr:SMI1/KNR4 family protein [Actinorhabdospora filicis]GLZ79847.1 hypothetical protein Afil01_46540 [Actinorhabdospora filicis]
MSSLEEDYARFRDLVGPLPRMATPHTWAEVETALGLEFPVDYKMWAEEYPSLYLFKFLHLDNPLDFPVSVDLEIDVLAEVREVAEEFGREITGDDGSIVDHRPALPFYPAPGGLLFFGQSDNGDYCTFLTAPDPREWEVVVTDGGSWWHSGRGFAAFLTGLLTGERPCPEFPEDLADHPSARAAYTFMDAEGQGHVLWGDTRRIP